MKIAVIGSGSIGQRHVRNIQEINPESVFVFVRREGKSNEFTESLQAKVFATATEAITYGVDLVIIATPSALHERDICNCLETGTPFYIEKPVVISQESINTVETALQTAVHEPPSMVGCNLRYLPAIQKMKAELQNGSIGEVARASLTAGQWLPDWKPKQNHKESYSAKAELGGGVGWDLIHEYDMARYLFGEFTKAVSMHGNFPELEIDSPAVVNVLLSTAISTPLVSLQLDYVARTPIRRYEIVGSKGTMVFDLPSKELYIENLSSKKLLTNDAEDFSVENTYKIAMKEFLKCVELNTPTQQSIHEGLKSVQLVLQSRNNQ